MNSRLRKVMNRDDFPFIFAGIIICLLFLLTPVTGDDVVFYQDYGIFEAVIKAAQVAIGYWSMWASRVLVNFTWFLVLYLGVPFFAIGNGIITYFLLKAIAILFKTSRTANIGIACLLFSFPFIMLSSAGWYATVISYYWPVAIGIVSLIPIAKLARDERMKKWEYVLYSLALIYGANAEQSMVFILFNYTIFCIWAIINKKNSVYIFFQEVLAIISMLICFLCPGNNVRKEQEIVNWFQDYNMLSIFDKVEIGISTTFYYTVFSGSALVIFVCIIITVAVWESYKDSIIRFISGIPLCLIVLLGPLKRITDVIFPQLGRYTLPVPRTGFINIETYGYDTYFLEFMLVAMTCVILTFNIVLIFRCDWKSVFLVVLLVGGAAGRIAMGFSPTIYASGNRTFANLFIILMVIGSAIIGKSEELYIQQKELAKNKYRNRTYIYMLMAFIGVLDFTITIF